jgi:hypothetical protein
VQCTPGRQAFLAPVPASDPLQLLPLVVEEDLQALTPLMSFTEHYGWQYATARELGPDANGGVSVDAIACPRENRSSS